MKDFVVHMIPGSPFARAVLVTLEEKGAHYRLAAMTAAFMRSPAHLELHPFGRMPILDHGEFRIYETQAIIRYLDRVLPGISLTPAEPETAARMDQLMNVNDWYLFQGAASVIGFQRVVGPKLLGLPTDEAAVAAAVPKTKLAIDEIARLLGRNAFLAGGAITLADLMVAPQLDFLLATPEGAILIEPHRNLSAWLARMNARRSMQATTWERVIDMAKPAPIRQAS
jgi:glutathione S-transferase